ncbi:MAG: histidine phosphatase family protein [Campylobacteraceae bacterium]|jgi:phosphohistidine phosphatase|nr:histidine phosphatase family protein [Campylobacteraceae bacterium]
MKTIYFIRHAKSDWSVDCDDFDRALNKRGEKDAPFMAERLKKYGVKPDIIITSPAKRALKTAKIIAKKLKRDMLITDANLYLTSPQEYLRIIREIDDKYNTIFIVGHNPSITEICKILSGAQIDNIPTCGIFCIKFDAESFSAISINSGKKLFFDFPKKELI